MRLSKFTLKEIIFDILSHKNRRWFVMFVLAIGVFLVFLGWLVLQPNSSANDFVYGNGRIEATEIDVATKNAGRLLHVYVNEGDFVKKGQLLAQMQTDSLDAQLAEAQAKHQQALDNVSSIEAQLEGRKSDFVASQAVLAQREAELTNAQAKLKRSQYLAKSKSISQQSLEDDALKAHTAEMALHVAKAQVALAQANGLATEAQLTSAKSNVEAIVASVQRINTEITDCQLRSPIAGKVQYVISHDGEVLGAGGKVLNLVDTKDMYITFFLPTEMATRVAIGDEVRIAFTTQPDYVIPAKLTFVASSAQFTPKTVETATERQKLMFRVKAQIDATFLQQNTKQIKIGMPAVAWIKMNHHAIWSKHLQLTDVTQ